MRRRIISAKPRALAPISAAVIALAVSFSMASDAVAQDISAEEYEAFEHHVERSGSLLRDGDLEEGIEELEQARAIVDHPRIAIRLAQAYLDWGRCAQAATEFEQLLERDDLDDETLAGVRERQEGIADCTEMVHLAIECTPEDAVLQVDGPQPGEEMSCSFSGDVPAGDYELQVSAEGYDTQTQQVTIVAGESREVRMALQETVIVEEIDEEDGAGWSTYASFGAIGVGSVMLVGAGIMDFRSGSRATELAEARDAGDWSRFDELESSAASARTTNMILYAGGLTLITGGLVLYFLDPGGSATVEEDPSGLSFGVSPTGVSATMTW